MIPGIPPSPTDRDIESFINNLQDVVFRFRVSQPQGIEFINKAITNLTFYNPEDFYNNPNLIFEIIHPDDLPIIRKLLTEAHLDRAFFRISRKDGKLFRVEAHCTSMFNIQGTLLATDGSLRVVADARLISAADFSKNKTASEHHIHTLETGNAIVTSNRGVFLDANKAFQEDLGLSDELSGLSIINFYDWVFLEDRSLFPAKENETWTVRGLKIHLRSRSGINLVLEFSHETFQYLNEDCVLVSISEYSIHQQMKRYMEELAMVSNIGRTLAETLNPTEIYGRLAEAVHLLFPDGHALFISRFHAEANMLTCVYAVIDNQVLDPTILPAVPLSPPGKGVQSEAIHVRKPVVINDMYNRLKADPNLKYIGVDEDSEGQMARSSLCAPMMAQNNVLGVVQIQTSLVNRFHRTDADLLAVIANTAAIVLQNAELVDNLRRSHEDLLNAYDKTLEGWVHALDLRDQETEGHSQRVTNQAVLVASRMGLSSEEILNIRRGALLHDIGKIGVPDQILYKAGPLDEEEWKIMHRHPTYAYDMIHPIEYLRPSADIPYAHHEWWNGTGYPRGLKGEEISLGARIFALVDVWDALRSDRPYRKAWEITRVVEYIQNLSGKQFDPAVVSVFLDLVAEKFLV